MREWDEMEKILTYVTSRRLLKDTVTFFTKSVWTDDLSVITTQTPLGFCVSTKVCDNDGTEIDIYVDFTDDFKVIGSSVAVYSRQNKLLGIHQQGVLSDYPNICSFNKPN
jgi:hypothetical protein